jgi:polysaccharide export outer membrane protein
LVVLVSAIGLLLALTGCDSNLAATTAQSPSGTGFAAATGPSEELTIREGDTLKVSFPGTPSLDTTQLVRRDGRITLPILGEYRVTGYKPADLEKELVKLYASQLQSKEVNVTVVSSTFSVFVSGAVLHPGKITSDRPISALEAIMEAGGFDSTKADMRSVVVIRQEKDGRTKNYTLNLKLVLEGKDNVPFYLKPSDIVVVPEGFSWF